MEENINNQEKVRYSDEELAEFKELNRKLTTAEYNKVVDYFIDLGLTNGFVQEKTSSQTKYIPDFDMTGVK